MSFGLGRKPSAAEILEEARKGAEERRPEVGDSVVFDKATGAFIRTDKAGSVSVTFENGIKTMDTRAKASYHEAGLAAAVKAMERNAAGPAGKRSSFYANKILEIMEKQRRAENLMGPQTITDMVSNMQNDLRKLRGIGSAQEQFADNHETIEEIRRSLEGELPSGSMITADTIRVDKLMPVEKIVHAPIPSGPVGAGPLTPRPMSKKPQSYEGWSMDLARWERGLESGRRQEFRERRMELERQLKEEFERGR